MKVNNKMATLRLADRRLGEALQDYYHRLKLERNVSEFENLAMLDQSEQMLASLALLGELPSTSQSMYPVYANRDLSNCCQHAELDFKTCVNQVYAT